MMFCCVHNNGPNAFISSTFTSQASWKIQRRPRNYICHERRSYPQPSYRTSKWTMHSFPTDSLSIDQKVKSLIADQNFVVTGATGLIGTALVKELLASRANVTILARNPTTAQEKFSKPLTKPISVIRYNAETSIISSEVFNAVKNADVVINLAGKPVDDGRWTDERKQVLWKSRVLGTNKLVDTLTEADSKAVFVSSSAVGYYGTSETKTFTEEAGPGEDFLATLAAAWEEAALRNMDRSRTVVLRMGVVLASGGGALQKMAMAFQAYLGGPPGSGQQWFSWVHIDDVIRLILQVSVESKWEGVYNATAPQPVRLGSFCKELGRAMGKPSWFSVPPQAVKALMGSEAAELILSGQQVLPRRTRANGFTYKFKDVGSALQHLMKTEKAQLTNTKK